MTSRRPLVAANWKMNGTLASLEPLARSVVAGMPGLIAEVVLCVPAPYLGAVRSVLAGSNVALGAQNVSAHESGAHTGEVSAAMLKDYNCRFAIVGHSERRSIYHETDAEVAARFVRAVDSGLTPILCIGEQLSEREAGDTAKVIARQLDCVIAAAGRERLARAVIAYEPVWAIGTGRTATPAQAQEVHALIRARLKGVDAGMADSMRILYGGSVKGSNAEALFTEPDVDGGLIGGASLDADEFLKICKAAR